MDNKVQAEIITDFTKMFAGLEIYQDFFEYNDLGVPLAIAFEADLCTLTQQGVEVISETYDELIKALQAPAGEYSALDEIIAAAEESNEN